MKKHSSVLMLLARSTIYRVLALLVLLAVIERVLFGRALPYGQFGEDGLKTCFSESYIVWAFGLYFLLLTALLCTTGCALGSRTGDTLRRLRISEKAVFLWQCGYNACCYLLFWAVQVGLALYFCRMYTQTVPDSVTNQTVFLAFYRVPLLHSLLPLAHISRWVRNFLLLAGLSITAAGVPYAQRRGECAAPVIALVSVAVFQFVRDLSESGSDVILSILSIVTAAVTLISVLGKEAAYDDV